MKKKWNKPELIILSRGDSSEAVLQGCKSWSGSGAGSGPSEDFSNCKKNKTDATTQEPCVKCSESAKS